MNNNGIATLYAEQVYSQTGYHAVWRPDKQISLGDIGKFQNGVFVSMNENLTRFDIDYHVEDQDQNEGTKFEVISDGVNVKSAQAGMGITGLGNAQTEISFNQNFGVWIDIPNCKISILKDLFSLGDILIEKLYRTDPGKWQDIYIVHELVTAQSGKIVISENKGSKIMLDADLKQPIAGNLVNANVDVNSQNPTSGILEFTVNDKFRPFFKVGKFQKSWFLGNTKFTPQSDSDKQQEGAEEKVFFEEDISFFDLK